MVASNTYGRQVVVPLTNKSGGSVAAGDVVYLNDGTNADSFTTGTTASRTGGLGIAQETIASNATGRILVSGYAALVNVQASVTIGHYGASYSVVKQATDAGVSRAAGTFCQFQTGGTTPDAIIWQPDLGAGSGFAPVIGEAAVATQQSTASTSYTDLATAGPSVTLTVNTKVKITVSAEMFSTAACNDFMGVVISGANTASPDDTQCLRMYIVNSSTTFQCSRVIYLSGLTPGSTTFKAQYRVDASTGFWRYRHILVETLD